MVDIKCGEMCGCRVLCRPDQTSGDASHPRVALFVWAADKHEEDSEEDVFFFFLLLVGINVNTQVNRFL